MAKYTKQIELILKLVEQKKITINVNSERTAVAEAGKMYDCLDDLNHLKERLLMFKVFKPFSKELQVNNWPYGMESMEEIWGPFHEFMKIYLFLTDSNLIGKKLTYENRRVGKVYHPSLSNIYPHQGIGIGFLKETNEYRYFIEWIPSSETKTRKRITQNDLKSLQNEVREKIGTLYNLPSYCGDFKRNYDNIHTEEYINAVNRCKKYISGEMEIQPCSPRQAQWVAKMLNIPESIALKFNSYQASEILDYSFNKNDYYTTEEQKEVKDFYLNKANTMNESKNMKLTEKDLHYIIAEATRRIIKEHTNPFGYSEYQGEDMTFDSVYDNAEHALVMGLSNGIQYSSVHELIDELYDSKSFNEADYETVYDACEEAMMDVYGEDQQLSENNYRNNFTKFKAARHAYGKTKGKTRDEVNSEISDHFAKIQAINDINKERGVRHMDPHEKQFNNQITNDTFDINFDEIDDDDMYGGEQIDYNSMNYSDRQHEDYLNNIYHDRKREF